MDDPRRLDAIAAEFGELAVVSVPPGMALVCVVGDGLQAESTAVAHMIRARAGGPLRMISQTHSQHSIIVVLRQADLAPAAHRLHEELFG